MRQLRDNVVDSLKRDPRRTGVLVLLLTVLGIMVWRFVMTGPARAVATAEQMTDSGLAATIAYDVSRSAALSASWREQPVPHLSRNLFTSPLTDPLPDAAAGERPVTAVSADGLFWRQLEQALAVRADRDQYRQALAQAALRDAEALELQSVVMAPDSWAMIGGKVVRVGDILGTGERGPFTLIAIERSRVVLARDGQRVSLSLGRGDPELLGYE